MSLGDCLLRRAKRIFPLMWIILLTASVGELVYYNTHEQVFWWGGGNNSILTLFLNLFGLQAVLNVGQSWNYPGWSLSVFFLCWLVYWIIIKKSQGNKKKRVSYCILMVVLGITLQISYPNLAIPGLTFSAARGYISFLWEG